MSFFSFAYSLKEVYVQANDRFNGLSGLHSVNGFEYCLNFVELFCYVLEVYFGAEVKHYKSFRLE